MPNRRPDWTNIIDFPSHKIDIFPSRNLFLGNLHPPINAACLSSDQKEERRLLGNTGTTRETHALHKAPSDMLSRPSPRARHASTRVRFRHSRLKQTRPLAVLSTFTHFFNRWSALDIYHCRQNRCHQSSLSPSSYLAGIVQWLARPLPKVLVSTERPSVILGQFRKNRGRHLFEPGYRHCFLAYSALCARGTWACVVSRRHAGGAGVCNNQRIRL
jgi:hypothetical protein